MTVAAAKQRERLPADNDRSAEGEMVRGATGTRLHSYRRHVPRTTPPPSRLSCWWQDTPRRLTKMGGGRGGHGVLAATVCCLMARTPGIFVSALRACTTRRSLG